MVRPATPPLRFPPLHQARVRLDTHNSNVAATIGYYKDIMVKVGRGAKGRCGEQGWPALGHRRLRVQSGPASALRFTWTTAGGRSRDRRLRQH